MDYGDVSSRHVCARPWQVSDGAYVQNGGIGREVHRHAFLTRKITDA